MYDGLLWALPRNPVYDTIPINNYSLVSRHDFSKKLKERVIFSVDPSNAQPEDAPPDTSICAERFEPYL